MDFDVEAPGVDEADYKNGDATPSEVAAALAAAKAHSVHARFAEARESAGASVIIASDQVAALGDRILDKPMSEDKARASLRALAGCTHQLFTAVHILEVDAEHAVARRFAWVDETRLTMRALDDGEIARYVARDQALDCAGAYKIESLGITLFERVDTGDATAIEGLPLARVASCLRELGFRLP